MTKPGLAKFKIIAISTTVFGILATFILPFILISDLAECPPYVSASACLDGYFSMTSYGKYVYYGAIISPLVAIAGIVMVATWFFMNRTNKKSVLTPGQIELHEAEKEYARSVKEAAKVHRATIKSLEKVVQQAEKALKVANEMGQRKLAKYQSAIIFEDRLETPQGAALLEDGGLKVEASPSGNLNIIAPGFQSLIEGKPEQFEKARVFAGKIQEAVASFPKMKEEKSHAIARANEELEKAKRDLEIGSAKAQDELAKVKADTGRLDAARMKSSIVEPVQETA